jgi:hypothetical protein
MELLDDRRRVEGEVRSVIDDGGVKTAVIQFAVQNAAPTEIRVERLESSGISPVEAGVTLSAEISIYPEEGAGVRPTDFRPVSWGEDQVTTDVIVEQW